MMLRSMYKFRQLAQNIQFLIESGSWPAHKKLPSLRAQAQSSGYSLMTVLNAYQELEAKGWIYTKQKSGYYVSGDINISPEHTNKVALNTNIEINSLVFDHLKRLQQDHVIPLGSAFPSVPLLCNIHFMKILSQHAKLPNSSLSTDSMPPGSLHLRQILASRYSLNGISTQPEDIVITSGALDALNLSLQALTKPGDFILLQQTIFYGAWQAAERLGLNVITIPEHPEHGFDVNAFESALKNYPIKVCWLMLNAHNPIGFTVSNEIKLVIAELLHRYKVYLIEDDVYQELFYEKQKPLSVKHFDKENYVLHCSSFSKILGAGVRVGWVHSRPFSNAIQHLQLMSTVSASNLMQHALVDFIGTHHYEKHLRQLRLKLQKNKNTYYKLLKEILPKSCKIYLYATGYFLWIQLPINVDSTVLYQHLLDKKIVIAPSILFQQDNLPRNYIRLNCSFNLTEPIKRALYTVVEMIKMLEQNAGADGS
ncbi:DNA-binding transcriptional regulator [Commensalibacter communis]|nr:DNA-binding transcriptional regulator [Commensalibacter communis]